MAATTDTREFLVTGEVSNLAARFQAVADGIAVSEETYRLVAPTQREPIRQRIYLTVGPSISARV